MIATARWARENDIPYFGICLGLQIAVIEFARNVCNLTDANSTEFQPNCANAVIDLMDEQKEIEDKGGTMRLGAYPCAITIGTLAHDCYQEEMISERHRHRWEFNNSFLDVLTSNGLVTSGHNPDQDLVEIVENPTHPWFVGVQFHPEFKSKPIRPHPLFHGFVEAALKRRQSVAPAAGVSKAPRGHKA
jgi:CTP synthase